MKKLLLSLSILFGFVPFLHAQTVGVVLSGGGAKGLYHIGILKALEENGIPIDYISGTSMGSIVAGLYAAGYSPWEIEKIFESDDVPRWLTGKIEDRYFYYFKKQDPRPAIINLDIDLQKYIGQKRNRQADTSQTNSSVYAEETAQDSSKRKRLSFSWNNPEGGSASPASLLSSVQLDVAFLNFMAGATAKCKNNFDSLFVPFRCVSVDILKRKEYVWSHGDLGTAIRSSMAIPIVFKPVKVDTMMMYDGGILNNFPWKETEEAFHPDVIIGGKCVSGNPDINNISGQIEMLTMSRTDYNLPEEKGIMISRDIDVGMLDYKKAPAIIEQGYHDALVMMPLIKERITRRVSAEEVYERRMRFKSEVPSLVFDRFQIEGLPENQSKYYLSQLQSETLRDSVLDFEKFKTNYFKMLSDGSVEGGMPVARYNDTTGYFALRLPVYNKPRFKAMVGLNISSTSVNQGYIGLQYNRVGVINSLYMLDGYIGSYYSSAQIGARYDYVKKRPFYIESYFTYNFFDYARGNSQRIAYKNTSLQFSRLNDMYVSALIGTPIGKASKLELRGALGHDLFGYYRDNLIGENDERPDRTRLNYFTMNLSLKRNSLNYSMYPTRGLYQSISLFGVLYNEKYRAGKIAIANGHSNLSSNGLYGGASFKREDYLYLSKWFNIGYLLEALYMNSPGFSNQTFSKMALPGFTPNPHSKTIFIPEFHNRSYAAVGLMPIVEASPKAYLKGEFYCYMPDLTRWTRVPDRLRYIASATLVYQSPVGPVSFNYSHYAVSGVKRDYFTFNIGYLLFNKKGIQYE